MCVLDFINVVMNIYIPEPKFDSSLVRKIIELEKLRYINLKGSTPSHLFFQLKEIFHFLESIGSLRIEGNNTTIAEYVENKIKPEKTVILNKIPIDIIKIHSL